MTSFPIRLFFKHAVRHQPHHPRSYSCDRHHAAGSRNYGKPCKAHPWPLAGAVEWLIEFVRDNIVYQVMGELRGKRYVPMITTVFCTLLVFNLCGIIRLQHRGKRVHHAASGVRHVVLLPVLDCRHP